MGIHLNPRAGDGSGLAHQINFIGNRQTALTFSLQLRNHRRDPRGCPSFGPGRNAEETLVQ